MTLENVLNVICAVSILILWFCIGLNIHALMKTRRLEKLYDEAIEAANGARDNFLEAAEGYGKIVQELEQEKEYYHNLIAQKEDENESR